MAGVEIFIEVMIIVIDLLFTCWLKRIMANYRVRLSARRQQQHIRQRQRTTNRKLKRHYPLLE